MTEHPKSQKHIRFFNIVEPVSTFFRDLAPYLVEHGFSVSINISDAEYRSGRSPLEESLTHPAISMDYVKVGQGYKTSKFRKVFVYIKYILTIIIRTLLGSGTDLNFFLTQPPLFSIWGVVLKILRRQKYCVLIMDLYPDILAEDGLMSRNIGYRVMKYISRFSLRHSDGVIVIGRCMKERLLAEGFAEDKITVIPNWVDERIIFPVTSAENPLRKEWGLQNIFVVLYSGNMGNAHSFDDILTVARNLVTYKDIKFVFIGDGSRRGEIEQSRDIHQLDNIILKPFQPLETLAYSQNLGDAHFVSLRSGFEGLVVPSKTYGALAVGRPVIYQGEASGEIARMIQEEQIGKVIALNAPDKLMDAILDYYRHPEQRTEAGKLARELSQQYSRESMVEKYLNLLNRLTGN